MKLRDLIRAFYEALRYGRSFDDFARDTYVSVSPFDPDLTQDALTPEQEARLTEIANEVDES